MRSLSRPLALLVAVTSLALGACGAAPSEDAADDTDSMVSATPKLCAAVRGNGESILTHFASLARIVEHYGVIDGMAGGSSGSITTFAYESILKNPVMHRCGARRCSADADAARVALALKSVQGYANVVGDSDEAVSIKGFAGAVAKLKADYAAKGIDALIADSDVQAAADRLKEILSYREIRALVNPEVLTMLADVPHLTFNVNEIKTSISQLGAFKVDDNRLFFRTGLLAWPALASLFGRVGDFYAGYGPADTARMNTWLDACAAKTRGKPWTEAAKVTVPSGGTCGSLFEALVTNYRAKSPAAEGTYASRIDERVGNPKSPLHKLVSTAVLEGDAITKYKEARARYLTGEFPTGSIPFEPAFSDVNFGYWGSDADLARVQGNDRHFEDLKTKKLTSLGNASWREILAASPAEPGLSRFVELSDGRFSGGGWSDLAPALVLRNLGCEQVVYVTREGDESGFATKIAKQAGMSEADWKNLYDLGNPASSYSRSIAAADGVWCTNWNGFTDAQMSGEILDSWSAPFETRPSFATGRVLHPYSGATSHTGKAGCTPGVSGGAKFPQ